MAAGDRWRQESDYHIRLYRDGNETPYTICKVWVRGVLIYELWKADPKKPPVCLARDDSAGPLKDMVPAADADASAT